MSAKNLPYQRVIIIFNPKSTGDGPALAKKLATDLRKAAPDLDVELLKTRHQGHAAKLAEKPSPGKEPILVVSASGDGGYHEVVNGAINSGAKAPMCMVLPSGNANDHANSVAQRPVLEAILAGELMAIDVLEIELGEGGPRKYAHSYAGLGISPAVAEELNKYDLNAIKESWLTVKTFWNLRPVKIEVEGKTKRFYNLLFANIDRMAKHLKLSDSPSIQDGKFEVIATSGKSKLRLFGRLIKNAFKPVEPVTYDRPYVFTTRRKTTMQLDGELVVVEPNTRVTVSSRREAIRTPV